MVVVEERGNPAGLRQAPAGEEEVSREGGRRQGFRCGCPPSPPLSIGGRERGGGEAQPCPFLQGRGAAKGGRSPSSPRHLGGAFPFEDSPFFSYILAHGPLGAGALCPYRPRRTPYSPCGPPGQVDPPSGPPDPFRHSRYNTDKVRNFSGDQNKTS